MIDQRTKQALILSALIGIFAASHCSAAEYYIDSAAGSDDNNGLSKTAPWKSHAKVSSVVLMPGDVVFFKTGSAFSGPIKLSQSGTADKPITLTSYGKGKRPKFTNPNDSEMNGNCIRIAGSYVIIEGLHFHDTPPTLNPFRLFSIFRVGAIFNMHGAEHNIIRNNVFIKCTKAIQSTGEHTLITKNYMDGPNHQLWTTESKRGSWGPIGIHLGIGNQEVSYNTIKNYLTLDSAYGSDGGAIELDDGRYHKDNFYIHHNFSEGNAGFIESSWKYDNNPNVQEVHNLRVSFNICHDGQAWLYMWAPCHDTYFDNNTVIRTKQFGAPGNNNDGALVTYPGIKFRNNLFVYTSTADAYQGGGSKKCVKTMNWYLNINEYSAIHSDKSQAGSGDPLLVDLKAGNYHLKENSPLRSKAENLGTTYTVDFDGQPLAKTGNWDIGALQYSKK